MHWLVQLLTLDESSELRSLHVSERTKGSFAFKNPNDIQSGWDDRRGLMKVPYRADNAFDCGCGLAPSSALFGVLCSLRVLCEVQSSECEVRWMTGERSNRHGGSGKAKRTRAAKPQAVLDGARACIEIERSGNWMPAEELRDAALGALEAGGDVTVNLAKVDHLDASALQILLALDAAHKKQGRSLQLANASGKLLQWFEYAGAGDRFSMTGRKSNE
jgi:anti-anti-sigma regulatory factor